MKKLSKETIQLLANRPGVKSTPVHNFLGTLHESSTYLDNLANLDMDARLYKWNEPTKRAIYEGIKQAFEY